jgi:hypothetical protein
MAYAISHISSEIHNPVSNYQNLASLLFEQGLQGVDCSGASAPPIKPFSYSPYLKGKNPMKSIGRGARPHNKAG